ncbi:MAG: FMN-binding protein [Bacillota bacterium]|nr:FMN-binding protein [Bacillota bacterium]
MRRKRVVILTILAAVVIGAYIAVSGVKSYIRTLDANLKRLAELPVSDVDISAIADGTYSGSYQVFPVAAEVRVTLRNHRIAEIELVKHRNGQGAPAEAIPGRVVEAQTLDVDTISGATYSSKVILKAIENALASAGK